MSEQSAVSTAPPAPAIAAASQAGKRHVIGYALAVGLTAALTGGVMWVATRTNPPRVSRFELTTSGPSAVAIGSNQPHVAITRDGSKVIYAGGPVGAGRSSLFVRSIDRLEATLLASPGFLPFVSPDGEWVGFFSTDTLRKVAITGGPSIEIAKYDGGPRGATWGPDTIIFSTN